MQPLMLILLKTACGAHQVKEVPRRQPDYLIPIFDKQDWSRIYEDDQPIPDRSVTYRVRRFVWTGTELWHGAYPYARGEQASIDVYEEQL